MAKKKMFYNLATRYFIHTVEGRVQGSHPSSWKNFQQNMEKNQSWLSPFIQLHM
jgi:hypothetical protein